MHIAYLILLTGSLTLASSASMAACNIVNGKAYGDCDGVAVHEGTKQTLAVRSYVNESTIVGGATVYAGGTLHLSGVSNGDIVVHKGGRLSVTGIVNGAIRNEGGIVEIEGTVTHLVSNGGSATVGGNVGGFSGTGPATFRKGSVLAGQPLTSARRLP